MSTDEKFVLFGGPDAASIDPHGKSLGEIVLRKLAEYGQKNIFTDGISGSKLAACELRSRIVQCAKILQLKFGVKEGDVVGMLCENRLEVPIIVFATICLGAAVAPLNCQYSTRELHHALDLSRPRVLFVTKLLHGRALQVAAQNSFVEHTVCLDDVEPNSNILTLESLVKSATMNDCHAFECRPVNMKENVSFILCSSGTTGLPKGVELTQFNILKAISNLNQTLTMAAAALERVIILMVVPLFHVYGLLTTVGSAVSGAEIVMLPKFEEHSFLGAIQRYKTNIAFLVPPLVLFLAKSPLVDKYNVSSLMIIGCGAAPLSKDLQDAVTARLNVFSVRQGYGMSEMTLSVLCQSDTHAKAGSVGNLRPGVWGKIIDPESGRALGPNELGEMCFKGSAIMKGYIRNPEATQATIDADGWLHTGDIGYHDDHEEWFIVDRIKELIKYKGFQVPPAEIEAILLTHPEILDAAVIGIPDESAGELPLAFVVRRSDSRLTEREICDFVARNTSHAKRLHGGVRFIKEIPKNPSGKILRRILRERFNQPQIQSKL